jgi:ATP-dependent Clp protease adapter protein ClpS
MNRDNQTRFINRQVDTFWYNVHTYQVSRLDDNSLTKNYVEAIFQKSIELDEPLSDKD